MDFKLEKQAVNTSEIFCETCVEQAIDLEMNLPDYCSDIKSILKCFIYPNINSVSVSGQRVTAQGNAVVRLVYVNDDEKIDCYEQTVELSKFVEIKDLPDNAIVTSTANVQYINCRAASQRRANVSANISICFSICHSREMEFAFHCDDAYVQIKNNDVQIQSLISQNEKTFDLSETLVLSADKSPVGKILRSDAWAVIQSKKMVSNKLLIKGELFTQILYCSDSSDNKFEKVTHTMPISQIIELAGIDENSNCDVNLSVKSLALQTKTDSNGENKLIEIACKVSAFVKSTKNVDLKVISDCYCTNYEISPKYDLLKFEKVVCNEVIQKSNKSTLELSCQEIKNIIDVWCSKQSSNTTVKDDKLTTMINLSIGVIYIDENDKIQFNEKNIDIDLDFNLKEKYEKLDNICKVEIEKIEFAKLAKEKVEVKIQANIHIIALTSIEEKICTEIAYDEEKPKKLDDVALTVYFSNKNESIWDIAQRYNTTIDAINSQNNLSGEYILDDMMLIIPCV